MGNGWVLMRRQGKITTSGILLEEGATILTESFTVRKRVLVER